MIDGNTLIYATPGNPVAQVRLPQVMEVVFRELKHNAVWVPMHVDHEGLKVVVQALRTMKNFRGMTVAIPHKPAVGALLDRLSTRAQAAGAVNLVRREPDGTLYGDIVDGAGFVRGLELKGHAVKGAAAWLVGVGGGGSAIAASLAEAGVGRLYMRDADATRARAMVERLRQHYPAVRAEVAEQPPRELDYAINATPVGLQPQDPMPFDPAALPQGAMVCDIIMKPRDTRLLQAAQARGLRVQHGQHMMDAQVPMYLDFLGIPYPDEAGIIAIAARS